MKRSVRDILITFMKTSNSFIEVITDLAIKIQGLHIIDIRKITERDFLFVFSESKEVMMTLSLDAVAPLIALVSPTFDWQAFPKVNIQLWRSHLLRMKIDHITTCNDDYIVCLTGHRKADNFDIITYQIIFELIRKHPNVIIKQDERVIYTYKTYDLETNRPLGRGLPYTYPLQSSGMSTRDYQKEVVTYLTDYYDRALTAQAQPFTNLLVKRKKQLDKKIIALNHDLFTWEKMLTIREDADLLLTYTNLKDHLDNVTLGERVIKLDSSLSVSHNIKKMYHQYQKAKKAQVPIKNELTKANDQLNHINKALSTIPIRTMYELEALMETVIELGLKPIERTIAKQSDQNQKRPYYVTIDNIKFSFGRNAIQNDYLTFKLAEKNAWFFHIKHHPGAHVICHEPKLTPQCINLAASIALALARQATGEVDYAPVSSLKKGFNPGQVFLNKYQTVRLLDLHSDVHQSLQTAKRYDK